MEAVSNNLLALLPEYALTLVGVLIMLLEPVMPAGRSRRPLGWFAVAGTLVATGLSLWQLHLGIMTAFSNSIRVDSYSVFFQVLIGLVAAATLLSSLDFFGGEHSYAGEYYALVCFGTVGMMLMCCSTELLMVFVGLEISSIATYIMAGFRKGNATSAESSLKYFLLGSFATAFFLYGIALTFRRDRIDESDRSRHVHRNDLHTDTGHPRSCDDHHRHRLQGLRSALSRVDAGRLPGRPGTGGRLHVDRSKGCSIRGSPAHPLFRLCHLPASLADSAGRRVRAVHVHR